MKYYTVLAIHIGLLGLGCIVKSQPLTIYEEKNAWDATVIQNGFEPKGTFAFVEKNPSLPDILLIGNSISIGYTQNVRNYLRENANVYRIPQNAGHTITMLEMHHEWLQDKKWDVIHFNFGLHDLKYVKNGHLDLTGKRVVSPEAYKQNLKAIVKILQQSVKENGTLIFATTSVIPEGARGRMSGDEVIYNQIATEVLSEFKGIVIDDQYQLTKAFPKEQKEQNVHFFPEGKDRQGRQVAASILRALGSPGQSVSLKSPDKNLTAVILRDTSGRIQLKVEKKGEMVLLPSRLGIVINEDNPFSQPMILTGNRYEINETYPWHGNHSIACNQCNGIILPVNLGWDIDIRLFNDGLAFRYSYVTRDTVIFTGETTVLKFRGSLHAKYMQHKMSEESRIYTGLITDIARSGTSRTMPPVLLYPENKSEYYAVLEGGGIDFHGYSLIPDNRLLNGQSICALSVAYAEKPNGWKTYGTVHTGWKIISITNTLNELVNTDIVHNVCPPPDRHLFPNGPNEPWIKPGSATWNWWARVSVDFEKQLALVDLASQIGADYHLVDIGWDIKWNDEHKDAYEYLKQLCEYAADKGIGILVWKSSDTRLNLELLKDEPNNKFQKLKGYDIPMDTMLMRIEVEKIASAGAKGIKLDYIQSENSTWKSYMEDFLRECAKNRLLVDFHGCPIPAGESRTYPNEISREGIWGGEKLRGGGGATKMPVAHYIDQLFTRLIAGHADFTPGIFDPEKAKGYTQAMQLASAMLFTSPLLVWADHPENYLASDGIEIIRDIPTVWDETIVCDGSNLSELAVFARRSGEDWYVAGINGKMNHDQMYQLKLNFLEEKKYEASICKDDTMGGSDTIVKESTFVTADQRLNLNMLAGGGFIIRLTAEEND